MIPEENVENDCWSSSDQTIPSVNGVRLVCSSGSLSLPFQQQHQMSGSAASIDSTNQSRQNSLRNESPQSACYSPYGNSPSVDHTTTAGYILMSPGVDFGKTYVQQIFFVSILLERFP